MKLVVLALGLFVGGGIAGAMVVNIASTFSKPRFPASLGVSPSTEVTNISLAPAAVAAPAEPERAPVRPAPVELPAAPQVAAVPDARSPAAPAPIVPSSPGPASTLPSSTIAPTPPAPAREQAQAASGSTGPEKAGAAFDSSEKQIRNLSKGRCGGRPMTSITVLPDGNVQVEC